MTCEPLTLFDMQAHGLSPGACPASQPVEPGSNEAAMITAGSGRKLSESFPLSGPLGRCSKILLESETWASPEFYLTWRASATKQGCSVFRLVPSVPRTGANGTGSSDIALWRPPQRESDNANRGNKGQDPARRMKQGHSVSLRDQLPSTLASARPTPTARDVKGQTQNPERMNYVPNIVKAWPTPQGYDGTRGGPTTIEKAKEGNHGQQLGNYLSDTGIVPPTCLARTESFVERLMTLSMWLMGYTAAYLAHWATASSRRLPKKSSKQ